MPNKIKIALAAAMILSAAFTAAAAAPNHRVTHVHPAINAAGPDIISDRCLPTGPPCRTQPDGW
jgi:hypothetical protein